MSTFKCGNCGVKLNAPPNSVGKQTRCAACGEIQLIPEVADSFQTEPISTSGQWYVKTLTSEVYGPARFPELRQWVAEGRIVEGCWLREPETKQWISVSHFFPKLANGGVRPNDPAMAETTYGTSTPDTDTPVDAPPNEDRPQQESIHARDDETNSSVEEAQQEQATIEKAVRPETHRSIPPSRTSIEPPVIIEPHRGVTVLMLGVFGFLLTCPVLTFFAWQFGATDLQKMDAGEMDTTGREMTAAGHLLGKIHLVIFAIATVFGLISLILAH